MKFAEDSSSKYFINKETREEIWESVKPHLQTVFERTLKFVRQTDFDVEKVKRLFYETNKIKCYELGNCEFPTGHIIIADPFCYLQNKNSVYVLGKVCSFRKLSCFLISVIFRNDGSQNCGGKY